MIRPATEAERLRAELELANIDRQNTLRLLVAWSAYALELKRIVAAQSRELEELKRPSRNLRLRFVDFQRLTQIPKR